MAKSDVLGDSQVLSRSRRWRYVAAVLSFVASVSGSASGAEPLARVAFRVQDNRIVFPLKVGSSPEMNVLLDTGLTFDGVLLFHEKWVEGLGLGNGVDATVAGAGDGDSTSTVMKDGLTLSVGGFEFPGQRVVVSRSLQTQRFPRDGVAGWTLLGHFVVEIDHGDMMITLHDPARFKPDASWGEIAIELRKGIPWVRAAISVEGEKEIPVSAYVDLAAGDALLVLVRPEMKLKLPSQMKRKYLGTGLSGDIYGGVGKVSKVRIGSFVLGDVVTSFPPAATRSKQEGADAIIGSDLLRRFNVILDYEHLRMYLKPNKNFDVPFE